MDGVMRYPGLATRVIPKRKEKRKRPPWKRPNPYRAFQYFCLFMYVQNLIKDTAHGRWNLVAGDLVAGGVGICLGVLAAILITRR